MARADARSRHTGWPRWMTVVEVLLAFGVVHVAFRAFRQFTPIGRAEVDAGMVLSPGIIMTLGAIALIVLRRGRLADFGLSVRDFRANVNIGLIFLVLVMAAGTVALACGIPLRPDDMGPLDAVILAGLALGATAAGLALLAVWPQLPRRIPRIITIAAVVVLLAGPIVIATRSPVGVATVLPMMLWRIAGAGIGEEIFFRGYVQSRLDQAFGRPWHVLGVRVGIGVVGSSVLFGLVHALNPFDYFQLTGQLLWWHALTAAAMPYAWIRERTGTVVAPATLHVAVDLLGLAWLLLPAA